MSTPRRIVAALAVGSLIVAACGGDDDDDDDDATTASTTGDDTVATTSGGGDAVATTTSDDDAVATTAGDDATPTTAGDDATPTTAADGDEDRCTEDRIGGEVTMASLAYPMGLDPIVNRGTGNTGGNEILPLYDTLVRYDPETDEFVPMVAESLEPNGDFTEWTLTLREGVTFGNGDPLTADAVMASFARHQVQENRSANFRESQTVTEMEVVDPLTLVFRLDAPWARFPSLLAHVAGMVTNPAVVEAQGDNFNNDPTGAGVGPYEFVRWVPGEELVLQAKTDWWGGPVCIQQLRFIAIAGGVAAYEAFRNGDVQVTLIREASAIAMAREDGAQGITTIENAGETFTLNAETGPTADPLVRQALAAALDPEVINERAFDGAGLPSTALIAEQSPHYDGLEGPQPDPARAAELVEQAKAAGWDGNIEVLCQNIPEGQDSCLALKGMADAAGMNLTITLLAPTDLAQQVRVDRNYQMARIGMPVDNAEPWLRLSASVGTGGALNSGGYSNPDMDTALADLRSAADEDARKAALATIQEVWNETVPNLVYEQNEALIVFADNLKGVLPSQAVQIHFDQAYLES